jgi:hypothetical protein
MSIDLPQTGPNALNLDSTIVLSHQGYKDIIKSSDGQNLYWTSDVNCELPIKMGEKGMAGEVKPDTIPM